MEEGSNQMHGKKVLEHIYASGSLAAEQRLKDITNDNLIDCIIMKLNYMAQEYKKHQKSTEKAEAEHQEAEDQLDNEELVEESKKSVAAATKCCLSGLKSLVSCLIIVIVPSILQLETVNPISAAKTLAGAI
uniref:Uncharacterized protein n=1 Tax=Moniliophthora roreri TaxID=221103 RepID=A0A0W0EZR0_MONRR